MHTQSKSKRKALLLILSALGLVAVAAPSASAEIVSAKWGEKTSELRISGTLELEGQYGAEATCTGQTAPPPFTYTEAAPGGSKFTAWSSNNVYFGFPIKVIAFDCGSGTLEVPLSPEFLGSYPGIASYDTASETYSLGNSGFSTGGPVFTSGFGGFSPRYYSAALEIEFRNPGTEVVEVENEYEEMEEVEIEVPDSRLVFENTKIGEAEGHGEIRATGTLVVDDGNGNPRTLSH